MVGDSEVGENSGMGGVVIELEGEDDPVDIMLRLRLAKEEVGVRGTNCGGLPAGGGSGIGVMLLRALPFGVRGENMLIAPLGD